MLKRLLRLLLVILVLVPLGLILAYRFVPPPATPLMVIRLFEGEGLAQDWVPLSGMGTAIAPAVLAAEDNRFCKHWGFDWHAVQAAIADAQDGDRLRGASTISMQTAKNLFLWPARSFLRKGFEAYLTPLLELLWDKRRIVEVYLNIAEWGHGVYGVEAAARHYFDKPAAKLSGREAALLAAVLPNPREWSPSRPSDYIAGRARTIQRRVRQLGPLLDCVAPTG